MSDDAWARRQAENLAQMERERLAAERAAKEREINTLKMGAALGDPYSKAVLQHKGFWSW